jgi:hypothetical protein
MAGQVKRYPGIDHGDAKAGLCRAGAPGYGLNLLFSFIFLEAGASIML